MGMPYDLVLVRHGESEGNVATSLSKRGDNSAFTEEFMNRHSSTWRLTEIGKNQGRQAGTWIKRHLFEKLENRRRTRFYVSEYDRAKETAALLGIDNAEWLISWYLRERDWGSLDVMPVDVRREIFAENLRRKEMDPFYWTPVNGESMPTLCLRLEKILETLHRECDGYTVIMVVHGEVMWAMRYILERMQHSEIMRLEYSDNPQDKIHNCQILHYSRINPLTGDIEPYLNWHRSICPTDFELSSNEWLPIERKKYSNEELLAAVERRSSK